MMPATSGTRGERNNNPMNLNYMAHSPWRGQVGIEIVPPGMSYKPRFGRYASEHDGIRALGKQLLVYQERHGLRTIRAFAHRWAPAGDGNLSDKYAEAWAAYCRFGPDDDFPLRHDSNLANSIYAVIKQENGRVLYDAATITAACRDALGLPCPPISKV